MPDRPLRRKRRPAFEAGESRLSIVDLFSGCGGLTLGVAQAAHANKIAVDIPLAVDFEAASIDAYLFNFPSASARVAKVEEFFNGKVGARRTRRELETAKEVGQVDVLLGGPPCQGHSDLNNHTRRDDPKNLLYLRMARAAEVLRPKVVLIENVPAVVHDSEGVVERARQRLVGAGFVVASKKVELVGFGVPQTRKRHILIGVRADILPAGIDVASLLAPSRNTARDLRWAIGDLEDISGDRWVDVPSRISEANRARIKWLMDNQEYDLPNQHRPPCHQGQHSYVSMYGRLRWDQPAQTITSGFGSMGQGRFVHPSKPRTLTPHEAARLQGFPDYFKFDSATGRTQLSVMLGNAVPPPLSQAITGRLFTAGVL